MVSWLVLYFAPLLTVNVATLDTRTPLGVSFVCAFIAPHTELVPTLPPMLNHMDGYSDEDDNRNDEYGN
jgi:hypothetical protein